MKVEIQLRKDVTQAYAVLYASEITPELQRVAALLEGEGNKKLVGEQGERLFVLKPEELYMIRVENEKTLFYTRDSQFVSRKRLYELEAVLDSGFLRINKSTLINLQQLDYVEPNLGGLLLLVLKNGARDHISRKYLPAFKQYLGLK